LQHHFNHKNLPDLRSLHTRALISHNKKSF
jgi:hypothetical protein